MDLFQNLDPGFSVALLPQTLLCCFLGTLLGTVIGVLLSSTALGLVPSIALASGSIVEAIGMIGLGLPLGLTGTDIHTGTQRFTFGSAELHDAAARRHCPRLREPARHLERA